MGNQQSNDTNNNRHPFGRGVVVGGGGALGLSRAELDKRCQPSGLYESCHWDERAIRKLVGDGKAAARLKGAEYRTVTADHECPICFLYYEEVNVTKCCHANICTECFLQVRPQKEKHSICPFCNHNKFSISVAKKLSEQDMLDREQDEKRTEEARIRMRNGSANNETNGDGSKPIELPDANWETPASKNSFGSSLESDSRVAMMRKRSESIASSDNSVGGQEGNNSLNEASVIESWAMTPDERRRLEAEMRNQSLHPLALQVEAEAVQRRTQNEQNYNRSHSERRAFNTFGRPSRRRQRAGASVGGGLRDWNQIVEAFEQGGNGAVNSLDDLVVLEAAILLSMEEESRRASGDDSSENDDDFDAARHARGGFPLVRSFLASRGRDEEPATRQQIQNLARSLNSSRRRNQLMRSGAGSRSAQNMHETATDTASLFMRGVSEEEQLAMAIAASLQDQNSTDDNNNNTSEEGQDVPAEQASDQASGDEAGTTAGNGDGEAEVTAEGEDQDEESAAPTPAPAPTVAENEDIPKGRTVEADIRETASNAATNEITAAAGAVTTDYTTFDAAPAIDPNETDEAGSTMEAKDDDDHGGDGSEQKAPST